MDPYDPRVLREGETRPRRKGHRVFTGLIEEVGSLYSYQPNAQYGARITVHAQQILEDISLGDSISVNGACLTVVAWSTDSQTIEFDAVAETLIRTTLPQLTLGAPINLERALKVGSRLGGHYVSGHIDGQGTLLSLEPCGNGIHYSFGYASELYPLIASKGSITIDGISLTVVNVTPESFSVWIVPHTLSATNIKSLKPGMVVNLETDILAKYVHQALQHQPKIPISMDDLQKAGFT